ncbi:type IV toxin-antitoxin system AbiEi family antitoxin domain-containing protein [Corynebacterium sp. A21]|uniref:type IV toxin-antitoxin system AbiEi family antitoxin domain-containing protein n=1 Tax=Corynebacterium sp. A21 TaxID=3457318 RepID=UPI003FCF5879
MKLQAIPNPNNDLAQQYRNWYCCAMREKRRTYRTIAREIASENDGYITTALAKKAGVPTIELRKITARGGLENVAYGLYRDPLYPASEHDQLKRSLLQVGDGAYLRGETVLALLGLADVNPTRIHVATPRRVRSKLPQVIEMEDQLPGKSTVLYEGLESQPVEEALREVAPSLMHERLITAINNARDEGLLTRSKHANLLKEFS